MPMTDRAVALPLNEVLRAAYRDYADRPAVRDDVRSLTYAELGTRVRRLANGLRSAGLRSDDRLMVICGNRCEFIETDHACYAGSFARIAALPRLHPRELAHIASDAEPTAVIAESTWLETMGTEWIPPDVSIRSPSVPVRQADGRHSRMLWHPAPMRNWSPVPRQRAMDPVHLG